MMAFARTCKAVIAVGIATIVVAAGTPTFAQDAQPAPQKFTLDGPVALWTVAIKPDKTGDFETIMGRLREALMKSENAERRQQAAGWRVIRLAKPLPDGNIGYVHVINPVVQGADYSVMQTLYEAFPDERQALYDMYRGAFAQNLALTSGAVVLDMTKGTQLAAAPAPAQ